MNGAPSTIAMPVEAPPDTFHPIQIAKGPHPNGYGPLSTMRYLSQRILLAVSAVELDERLSRSVLLGLGGVVVDTGGSVVYCTEAMEHLSEIATIVYLKLDLYSLERRLGNLKQRGVVLKEGQTLKDLYDERCPLYEKYADIVISENHCSVEKTVDKVVTKLRQSGF